MGGPRGPHVSGDASLPLLLEAAGALLLHPRGPFRTIFLILEEHHQPLVLLDGLSVHEYRDLGEVLRVPVPVVLLLLDQVDRAVHLEGRLLEGACLPQ